MISSAKITATTVASHGSNRCEKSGSPRAPIASEVIVTPSCIAAMNRGGSAVMRSTARARRLPSRSSSRMRVRREVTRPYSAATKAPFSRIRPTRASYLDRDRHRRGARVPAAFLWALARRPRSHRCYPRLRIPISHTNICSILRPMRAAYRDGAVQDRAEPRHGDAVRLVAQPVHGLRAPLHVLLRPRLRAAGRPAGRRALRDVDPREGERRRGAAARARAAVVARRERRDRRRDRSVPAGRGPLPADARPASRRSRRRRTRSG